MSQRIQRVNALLQREISEQLRRNYRDSAVAVTISDVETSTDLHHARVYYSILGEQISRTEADALFDRIRADLQQRVSRRVVLKYFPKFEFVYDPSLERGAKIIELLDQLENDESR